MSHRTFAPIALVLALLLVACGDESGDGVKPPAPGRAEVTAPDDLGRLVPADAAALVYSPSIDRLSSKLRSVVGSVDPAAAAEVDFDSLLREGIGDAAAHVDRTRPVAVAASLPAGGGEPQFTFIVPLKDVDAAKKALGESAVFAGSYAAVPKAVGAAPSERSSALATGLPEGDVVLRADLAKVISTLRDVIDGGLEEAFGAMSSAAARSGGAQSAAMMEGVQGAVRDMLASAERLDLALSAETSKVDLDVTFTAKAGSALSKATPPKGDAGALAAHLPKDYPVVVALSVDTEALMKWIEPLMKSGLASMPAESRKAFEAQWELGKQVYGLMGDAMVMGFGFGEAGMEAAGVFPVTDAKAYLAKMDEIMAASVATMAETGVRIESLPETTTDGVAVRGWRMRFDVEKMTALASQGQPVPEAQREAMAKAMGAVLGKDGMLFRQAVVGDKVMFTMGESADPISRMIGTAKTGGKVPTAFAASLAEAGGRPSFLVHLELRSLTAGILRLASTAVPPETTGQVPTAPAGAPLPVVIHGTADGRVYRGGMTLDLGEIVRFFKSLEPKKDGPR